MIIYNGTKELRAKCESGRAFKKDIVSFDLDRNIYNFPTCNISSFFTHIQLCLLRATVCEPEPPSLYTGVRKTLMMCLPAAWSAPDIGGISRCVVFVSGCWAWHPSHTGNRPWARASHYTHRKYTQETDSQPPVHGSHAPPPACAPLQQVPVEGEWPNCSCTLADNLSNFAAACTVSHSRPNPLNPLQPQTYRECICQ